MNQEIKDRWIAALRSGDYKQGFHTLRREGLKGDTFCCLGVLCEIAVADGAVEATRQKYGWNYGANSCILPAEVLEWAELESSTGDFELNGEPISLVDLNDHLEWDFNQIANAIEAGL